MLLLFSFTFLHFLVANYASPLAPALYVFGDSIFDSGNNNYLLTLARVNYPPYGVNFIQGATGRFTNGRTIPDFLAEYLGLPYAPPYAPAYLSIQRSGVLTGLNYASGAAGILQESGSNNGVHWSFDQQLNYFEETVNLELAKHFKDSNDLAKYMSKSIFCISIGSNDYINNYLVPLLFDTSRRYAPQPYAQYLIDQLSPQLERLYRLGARKIILAEIGPIGCTPAIMRKYKLSGKCAEDVNQFVSYFNLRLPNMLRNLTSTLQGSYFTLAKVNQLASNMINNPSRYAMPSIGTEITVPDGGLIDTRNPCCTPGFFNLTVGLCVPLLKPCTNIDEHFFWDGFHQTETVFSVVGTKCINGSSTCVPMNIKQLVAK